MSSYDEEVEKALERKEDPEEILRWRTRENPEQFPENEFQALLERCASNAEECETCEHPVRLHEAEYGCDYEHDEYMSGLNADGWVAVRCGCQERIAHEQFQKLLEMHWKALQSA